MADLSPHSIEQAFKTAREEHQHPSRSWKGRCQEFVRTILGQTVGRYGSAYAQWINCPDSRKHKGGDPKNAPLGSALCYKGSGPNGHIMLKAHPFPNGSPAAWSNDLVEPGKIHKVSVYAPTRVWGQKYLGYITNINGRDIGKRVK
jgi:hypothetical protein